MSIEVECPLCGHKFEAKVPEEYSWQNGYDIGYCEGQDDATESKNDKTS